MGAPRWSLHSVLHHPGQPNGPVWRPLTRWHPKARSLQLLDERVDLINCLYIGPIYLLCLYSSLVHGSLAVALFELLQQEVLPQVLMELIRRHVHRRAQRS